MIAGVFNVRQGNVLPIYGAADVVEISGLHGQKLMRGRKVERAGHLVGQIADLLMVPVDLRVHDIEGSVDELQ